MWLESSSIGDLRRLELVDLAAGRLPWARRHLGAWLRLGLGLGSKLIDPGVCRGRLVQGGGLWLQEILAAAPPFGPSAGRQPCLVPVVAVVRPKRMHLPSASRPGGEAPHGETVAAAPRHTCTAMCQVERAETPLPCP